MYIMLLCCRTSKVKITSLIIFNFNGGIHSGQNEITWFTKMEGESENRTCEQWNDKTSV